MNQREMARWLRVVDAVTVVCLLLLALIVIPWMASDFARRAPQLAVFYWPGLIYVWVCMLPVFGVAIQAWQVFGAIGQDDSFCTANAKRLQRMSYLSLTSVVLCFIALVAMALLDLMQPGLVLVIALAMFVCLILAIVSAALSHLTAKAAALKAENDLTV